MHVIVVRCSESEVRSPRFATIFVADLMTAVNQILNLGNHQTVWG